MGPEEFALRGSVSSGMQTESENTLGKNISEKILLYSRQQDG
jgi:hypothetical protein